MNNLILLSEVKLDQYSAVRSEVGSEELESYSVVSSENNPCGVQYACANTMANRGRCTGIFRLVVSELSAHAR